ncbi:Phytoene dehydrogenase-related protein [Amycolatopsis marina]|uniref:Pyridine nucleotide-disulfide oxidoreductase domain-containing protein 2 n=1 Tax=Amycolatopsis marina TaxID=490629 RepID=A0A1I1CM19_9PSEU|nr:NAD(P)/FAD-dependent oxidoreductase [Amycolatopsis marina]SFB63759.1 Phytoene dehydrogenase-related protein [Amycolatopsis marina]
MVVGSGPNGLAAAVIMARAGLDVEVYEAAEEAGGGTRTVESIPGFRFDECSAVHPMALASPFFRAFGLAEHGVRLLQPDVAYAHPLDGGRAGLAWRDIERTVADLGRDGPAWRRLLGPLTRRWQGVVATAMSDLRRLPAHPVTAARFAVRMVEQGSPLWNLRFREQVAPALLSGVSAHAIRPPRALPPAGVGLMLAALAHGVGWPLIRGGSQAIADAMVADLRAHGGKVHLGHRIRDLDELPRAGAVLLDVSPAELLRIAARRLPAGYRTAARTFRFGGGACKVDFALRERVPWSAPGCERTGTLHLVGSREEALSVEREVAAGRCPPRPYVLAVQPEVVDEGRSPRGMATLSVYAHVPQGYPVDIGNSVAAQIERFAPGFRDIVLDRRVRTAVELEQWNPNYVGGDISAGAMSLRQTVLRPVPRWNPYATPIPGVYLCSASTPPGPGVHGMGGAHAAGHALRDRFGIDEPPLALLRS